MENETQRKSNRVVVRVIVLASFFVAACFVTYSACYLWCGHLQYVDVEERPLKMRWYQSSAACLFVPAAWIDAHLTNSAVSLAVYRKSPENKKSEIGLIENEIGFQYLVEPGKIGEIRRSGFDD